MMRSEQNLGEFLQTLQATEKRARRIVSGLLRHRADIDDVIQDTYLRLYTFDGPIPNPRAWMLHIARNIAIDRLLRQKLTNKIFTRDHEPWEDMADLGTDPERTCYALQELQRLADFVATLPKRRREAFVLIQIFGYRYDEVGFRLRLARRTLESMMGVVGRTGWRKFQARTLKNLAP